MKLTAAGLTVSDVAAALKAQNQLQPVGRFSQSGQQHLTLVSGLWSSVEDIAATPVLVKNGATVRVADIGQVFPGSPDRTLLITGNGRDAVSVSISQQIGANILSLQRGVDETLAALTKTLPAGLTITKVYDLAEFVRSAIENVRDAILIGGLLAVDRPDGLPAGRAPDRHRRRHAADGRDSDLRLHARLRRLDQPDVDGRPGRRHRTRHRRCGCCGGEHPSTGG